MTHWVYIVLMLPIAMMLGAGGRRIVGGLIGDLTGWAPPHLLACIWLGIYMGCAAALGMLPRLLDGPILQTPWWAPIAIGVGAVVGHCIKGLWDAAGMGHLPPDNVRFAWRRFARDYAFMSLYGLQVAGLGVLVALCPVVHGHWLAPLLGGLAVAPAYALAWAVWPHLPICRGVTGNPLQLAEWLAGGAIGAGLALMAV